MVGVGAVAVVVEEVGAVVAEELRLLSRLLVSCLSEQHGYLVSNNGD